MKNSSEITKSLLDHKSQSTLGSYGSRWIDRVVNQLKSIGPEKIYESIGGKQLNESPEQVIYQGYDYDPGDYIKKYLEKNGIILDEYAYKDGSESKQELDKNKRLISLETKDFGHYREPREGDFVAVHPKAKNKLEEAKIIPGLEKSEDIHIATGGKVSHLSDDVVKKLDELHGKNGWLVKNYGDDAFQGNGIYFPQKIQAMRNLAMEELPYLAEKVNKGPLDLLLLLKNCLRNILK